jgi:glycosyltransferase involved in cell wall biosynthesis
LATQTVKNTDLVLVENQETLQLLNHLGGAKRTELLLSCGLPSSYFTDVYPLRPPSPILKILWVARLFPRKGLRLALQAFSLIKPDTLFKMTILGDGPLTPYVQDWIGEFNLDDKVEHRGQVPWLDVKKEYLKNDVFLFSSLRDTFGSQLLEAMAHGLPIIALDHHGARDFLPDSVAIKIPVKNPADTALKMAQAVEYLANNPEDRIKMGIAGHSFVQSFSWDEKAKKMSLLYKEFTNSSKV